MQQAEHGHTRYFLQPMDSNRSWGNQLIPVCSDFPVLRQKIPSLGNPQVPGKQTAAAGHHHSLLNRLILKKNPISLHSQSPSPQPGHIPQVAPATWNVLAEGSSTDPSTVTSPTSNSALRAVTDLVVLPSPHCRKEETASLIYIQSLEYTRCLINSDWMESNWVVDNRFTSLHPTARAKQIFPISWVAPMLLGCFQYSL